jgi:hypothetical protein
MPSFSIIPGTYDPSFIFEKAGVTNHFGYEAQPDGTLKIGYTTGDENAVLAAIDAYPVTYADEVARPGLLAQLAAKRYEEQQSATFNGQTVPCDLVSLVMVNGAMTRLSLPGAPATVRWKLNGTFMDLDLATITAIGTAMADRIQACFDRESELAAQINAAADIDALALIDITQGW